MTQQPAPTPAPAPVAVPQTSTLAIVSLVCGVATWVFLPFVGAIAAVVTGHMARKEIRASAGRLSGDGLAIAGLVLGYLQVFFILIPICVIVILALLGPAIGNVFSNIVTSI